jgi:DNA invertase Pin-like site-specific DNA recombinase
MKIGYARTSTRKQEAGLAAQLRTLLEQNGCEEIFQEQVSGAEERAQLSAAIRCLRPGDQLVVTKLDRFARSLEHAIKLERCIAGKSASLVILDPAIDTSTSMGRLSVRKSSIPRAVPPARSSLILFPENIRSR